MSGVITDPLTDAELTSIMRYCGYPYRGQGLTTTDVMLFEETYRTLEYRLSDLRETELADIRGRLAALVAIEAALEGAYATLNVGSAAVFTRNPQEMAERRKDFDYQRRRLCGSLEVPPGPALQAISSRTVRLVV